VRRVTIYDCGIEAPEDAFSRDHVALCRVARDGGLAILRLHRAAGEGVSLGRFHRRPPGDVPINRRLSGGRAVVAGPGVVCLTGVFPSVAWLALGRQLPGPDQVLNRALRPLLGVLRATGADVFYGGRDLITRDGRPIAVASFTVLPDGVVVVEAHVAASTALDRCTALLARWDPDGLVLHDAATFTGTSPLERDIPRMCALDWASSLAEHAEAAFGCAANVGDAMEESSIARGTTPAFAAFQEERGPIPSGWVSAVGIEMLGAVEAAARVEEGRIAALELSGDLIATHESVAEIEEACVGQPPSRAAGERALLSVLTRPGRFALGVRDLPALIARLG
jgi:hypothetical protein